MRELDDAVVGRLKAVAKAEKISLEQKFRNMAAREVQMLEARFEAATRLSLEQTRGSTLDSTALIRAERDR